MNETRQPVPEPKPQSFADVEKMSGRCLKEEINKLLWVWLPPSMTLEKAEDVACKVMSVIVDAW